MDRVPAAWRGADSRRKRTCWASSPERASAVARKRSTRASHHAQREGDLARGSTGLTPMELRLFARAVPFHGAWIGYRQRGAARARVGSARAWPRPQRERAQRRASALHAQATSRSEREGWHAGAQACRRRNGGFSLVQCPSIVRGAEVASAARCAYASKAHVLGFVPRESQRRGAQERYTRKPPRAVRGRAGMWEHELAPKERRPLARAVIFYSARSECRQRCAAHARRRRTCWASSP